VAVSIGRALIRLPQSLTANEREFGLNPPTSSAGAWIEIDPAVHEVDAFNSCGDYDKLTNEVYDTTLLNTHESFLIYPNPSTNYVLLSYQYSNEKNVNEFIISDISGHIMNQTFLYNGNSVISIDISKLCDGLYFASIKENGFLIWTTKLIKIE